MLERRDNDSRRVPGNVTGSSHYGPGRTMGRAKMQPRKLSKWAKKHDPDYVRYMYYESGYTIPEIVKRLGFPKFEVFYKVLAELKIPLKGKKVTSDLQREKMARMYFEKGMSLQQIATKLKLGKKTVHRHIQRLGLQLRTEDFGGQHGFVRPAPHVIEHWHSVMGKTPAEIAEVVGVAEDVVGRWLGSGDGAQE